MNKQLPSLDANTLLDLSELFLTQSSDGGMSLTHSLTHVQSAADPTTVVNLTQLLNGEQEQHLMLSTKNLINADESGLHLLTGDGSEEPPVRPDGRRRSTDECPEQRERHHQQQAEQQEGGGSNCSRMMLLEAVDPRLVVLDASHSQQSTQQRVSVITTRSHHVTTNNGAASTSTKRS